MCEGYSKLTFFINDNSFGHQWKVSSFLLDFWNFQKSRDKKESGKMLESQAISSNLSVVHHKWPKVSFPMKRQWFDDE